MAEITYNVGKARILTCAALGPVLDLRVAGIVGSKTGVADSDLTTLAAIDALSGVNFHTERLTLTGEQVLAVDQVNNWGQLDSDAVAFAATGAGSGVMLLGVVLYDQAGAGTDAGRIPISYHDTNFGASGVPMDGGVNIPVSELLRAL